MYTYSLYNPTLGALTFTQDPDGWRGLGYKLGRDKAFHGVQVQVSFDLTWTGQARQFINAVFEAEDIEGVILFTLYRRNPNSDLDEPRYFGRLNLSKWREENPTASVALRAVVTNAEESGFQKAFLTADDTPLNLLGATSLSGGVVTAMPATAAYLHSRVVQQLYDAGVTAGQTEVPSLPITSAAENRTQYLTIGLDDVRRNDLEDTFELIPALTEGYTPHVYTAKARGPHIITGQMHLLNVYFDRISGHFDDAKIEFGYKLDPGVETIFWSQDYSVSGPVSLQVGPLDVPFGPLALDLEAGNRFTWFVRLLAYNVGLGSYEFLYRVEVGPNTFLRIEGQTQTDPTTADGLLAHEALAAAVTLLTGEENAFRSTFFGRPDSLPRAYPTTGAGALNLLTTGFALRGFPLTEKTLTSSFRDLFDALNCLYPLGVGIEVVDGRQVVVVEELAYFYRAAETTLRLSAVSAASCEVASDLYYNTVELGNQKWRISDTGGLDEPNAKHTYTTGVTQLKGAFSRLNKFSTAGALIEATRRQRYVDSATKDQSSDDDWFVIAVLSRGVFGGPPPWAAERDEYFPEATGVVRPDTAYNLRHTPARVLRRLGAPLAAAARRRPDPVLRLTASEGNVALTTRQASESTAYAESADLAAAALPAPLWRPLRWKITTQLTGEQLATVLNAPYGVIWFPHPETGATVGGFLMEGEIDESSGTANLTLLAVPDGI